MALLLARSLPSSGGRRGRLSPGGSGRGPARTPRGRAIGRGLALLAAALHAACTWADPPRTAPEPTAASPSVWSASRPDAGRVYLMGSVHLGTPAPLDLGPALARAFSEADELVLEIDLGRYDTADGMALAGRYGRVPPPETLRHWLAPETWSMLRSYLVARGLPEQRFLPYQPWFTTTVITVLEFQDIGYDPEYGVDRVLYERAKGKKRIVGLETLEMQFALLAELPPAAQELMLRDTLEQAEDFRAEAHRMISAWRDGDDEALSAIVFRHVDEPDFAAFYENVLFGRNRRMADRIAELARDGDTRLVVVGVAHMLEDQGIPALLGRRGFEVRKLAKTPGAASPAPRPRGDRRGT